jgi:hypothetical protein
VALDFLTNMSKKCKSLSHIAIQVKSQQKTISIEDKLDVISLLHKDEQIVDICHNVNLLIIVYIQFMIILVELKRVLRQELKCVARLPLSYQNEPYKKHCECESLKFLWHCK